MFYNAKNFKDYIQKSGYKLVKVEKYPLKWFIKFGGGGMSDIGASISRDMTHSFLREEFETEIGNGSIVIGYGSSFWSGLRLTIDFETEADEADFLLRVNL